MEHFKSDAEFFKWLGEQASEEPSIPLPTQESRDIVLEDMTEHVFGTVGIKVFPPGRPLGMYGIRGLDTENPKLSRRLTDRETKDELTIGVLEVDPYGEDSGKDIRSGKSPLEASLKLFRKLDASLQALADEIRNKPFSEVGKTDYFIGASRLVNSSFFHKNGFSTYEFMDRNVSTESHRLAADNYELAGLSTQDAEILAYSKPAKLAVISKETLLAHYPEHSSE
jgi:hypothetical protein